MVPLGGQSLTSTMREVLKCVLYTPGNEVLAKEGKVSYELSRTEGGAGIAR